MKLSLRKRRGSVPSPVSPPFTLLLAPPVLTAKGFHTNTERGFLAAVMKEKLQAALTEEWAKVESSERGDAKEFEVMVSQADRDPYEIM